MLVQLFIGSVLICATVGVQAAFIAGAVKFLNWMGAWFTHGSRSVRFVLSLSGATIWLVAALTVAVWMWAGAFLLIGLFPTLEEAVYFSVVSFTTLGFGDIILGKDWRLLSGLIAANGLILFSLSTAFLIEMIREVVRAQEEG